MKYIFHSHVWDKLLLNNCRGFFQKGPPEGTYLGDEQVGSILTHCTRHLLHRLLGSILIPALAARQGQYWWQNGGKMGVNGRSCTVTCPCLKGMLTGSHMTQERHGKKWALQTT